MELKTGKAIVFDEISSLLIFKFSFISIEYK